MSDVPQGMMYLERKHDGERRRMDQVSTTRFVDASYGTYYIGRG
jgi:hypothetical protein